jgi:hypothetical protein
MQKPFVSGLAEIQDRLGVMNDLVVAKRQVADLNGDGRLNETVADIGKWAEEENRANLSLLGNCLQLFSRNRPIW